MVMSSVTDPSRPAAREDIAEADIVRELAKEGFGEPEDRPAVARAILALFDQPPRGGGGKTHKIVEAADCIAVRGAAWALTIEWPDGTETLEHVSDKAARALGYHCDDDDSPSQTSPSPPPAENLAGQGEPVAWAYELWSTEHRRWLSFVAWSKPADGEGARNIRPLYAAPAPSRPADREEIAERICKRVSKIIRLVRALKIDPVDRLNVDSLVVAIEAVRDLALRDAPRDGGDGTQDSKEDHR